MAINNAGTATFGAANGTVSFEGLANGGSALTNTNTGTIRKAGTGDYSLLTLLDSQTGGRINVEGGTLRNFGGGTLNANDITVGTGATLTFQRTPGYTFSGINNFSGSGMPSIEDGTTAFLADAATELRTHNFRFRNATLSTLSGRGLLSHSGQLHFYPGTTNTISGTRVLTPSGATALIETGSTETKLINSAGWENQGMIVHRGGEPILSGAAGSALVNKSGGVLRVEGDTRATYRIPTENHGGLEVAGTYISLEADTKWYDGKASVEAGRELRIFSAPATFQGPANAVTGAGFLNVGGSSTMIINNGSSLAADDVRFSGSSSISGPGILNVARVARFTPNYATSAINGTQVNLLAGSANLVEFVGGTMRLQGGALLRNAGTLDFRRAFAFELNTGGILENAGTMSFTSSGNNPTFGGDGTGLFRTKEGSNARFFPSNGNYYTVGWPFDFAGGIAAESGMTVAFNRDGIFNSTAKITVPGAGSTMLFGTAPGSPTALYNVTGSRNEITGEGKVKFQNARVVFQDPTVNPEDVPALSSGATVELAGPSIRLEGKGTLAGTRFVFASPSNIIVINRATLETRPGPGSNWIATDGTLSLENGATFRNGGTLAITTRVGAWSGADGTLFHNTPTGRLVHETATTTNLDIPFWNEGFVEFKAGNLNFLKNYRGNGGIAVSGGSKVELRKTDFADSTQIPKGLEARGTGSELKVTLGDGQIYEVTNPYAIKAEAGGQVSLAGGGGANVRGQGATAVANGPQSMVKGLGTDLAAGDGGTLVGNDGGTLAGLGGGSLVGNDGGTLVGNDGSTLMTDGGGSLVGNDGSTLVGNDGSTLGAFGGGSLVGNDGSTLVGNDGSTLMANGGGNVQIGSLPGAGLRSRGATPRGPVRKMARLLTQPGANVKATGGGSIIVNPNGIVTGGGTFTGPGVVKGGGSIRPGNAVGFITWNGNLTFESESLLEMEIGGTAPATEHDRINISGGLAMNGQLIVSFLNGFGPGLTPASTFDMLVATGGVTSALDGTRVPVTNAYGSFLVSIVNGTTLRLSDYQTVPATFNRWAQRYGLTGADALPEADPNRSGLRNLMKYALGLDASASGNLGTSYGVFEDGQGSRYLKLSYTKPVGADAPSDLLYEPQRAASVTSGPWSGLAADVVPTGPAVPGPGNLETVTVRSTHTIGSGQPSDFLRLRVVLQSP